MAVDRLFRTLLSFNEVKAYNDDDFADRLSRTYTTSLLVLLAFLVSTKQFVGEPLSCWCPAYFTESHREYTNTICWVSNTFYVPFDRRIPDSHEELWKEKPMISYYQWVPLILMSQAVMIMVPALIWRFLSIRSGINVSSLMDAASVCQKATYAEIRDKTLRYVVNSVEKYLLVQREYGDGCAVRLRRAASRYCFVVGGKRHGNYLMVSYLVTKSLYLANAIGQLFLLDLFLGIDYHVYGAHIVSRLIRGVDWTSSERFPRITLCSFQIRHQARVHDYVVQCALTINLFNEKIFILIWFWYVFVATVAAFSLLQWLFRALYWPSQIHYVKTKLRAFEVSSRPKTNVSKFVEFYLRRDGLLLIRLLAVNCGELMAAETLAGLWENYGPERRIISENTTVGPKQRKNASSVGSNLNVTQKVEVV